MKKTTTTRHTPGTLTVVTHRSDGVETFSICLCDPRPTRTVASGIKTKADATRLAEELGNPAHGVRLADEVLGESRLGDLNVEQATIESVFGKPLTPADANFNDDDYKVDARWGFETPSGQAAIWSYRGGGVKGGSWSVWFSSDKAHDELLEALGQDR